MTTQSSSYLYDNTDMETLQTLSNAKQAAYALCASYDRLARRTGDDTWATKAINCRECGTYIALADLPDRDTPAIVAANFCRDRLCPVCARRRSLRIFSSTSKILEVLEESGKQKFLFLTLTVRNCPLRELGNQLDAMSVGYHRLTQRPAWRKRVLGVSRTTEITINHDDWSAHPHLHLLLHVPLDYGRKSSGLYWDLDAWKEQWAAAMGLSYDPQIDVQAIRGGKTKRQAIAEVSKYMAKPGDYLLDIDQVSKAGRWPVESAQRHQDNLVYHLARQLRGRRLQSYSGTLLAAQKALKLADPESGPLTDYIHGQLASVVRTYHWDAGCSCYRRGKEMTK